MIDPISLGWGLVKFGWYVGTRFMNPIGMILDGWLIRNEMKERHREFLEEQQARRNEREWLAPIVPADKLASFNRVRGWPDPDPSTATPEDVWHYQAPPKTVLEPNYLPVRLVPFKSSKPTAERPVKLPPLPPQKCLVCQARLTVLTMRHAPYCSREHEEQDKAHINGQAIERLVAVREKYPLRQPPTEADHDTRES